MKANASIENFLNTLESLNPKQLEAVQLTEGPVLVLAGPGTGKTQLLATRIGNILFSTDTQANNILCLTYTEAGAVAMKQRLQSIIGTEAYKVHIHTFHSFCNWVIQDNLDYFGVRDLQLISEIESIDLFYQLIDNFSIDHPLKKLSGEIYSEHKKLKVLFQLMKSEYFTVFYLQNQINKYLADIPFRNEFIYQKNGKDYKKGDPKSKLISEEIEKMQKLKAAVNEFDNYQKLMFEKKRYDFSDMINWVIKQFEQNETLLAKYQEKFTYILVDEFQDTNGAQSNILNLLTSYWESPNLFVVGDDDQAIYGFQGAELDRITQFVETYKKDLPVVILEENYRSSQLILDASAQLIAQNQQRLIHDNNLLNKYGGISKNLHAANTSIKDSKIALRAYLNNIHEAAGIVQEISKTNHQNLKDIAIIYRNHKDVSNIIAVFNHLKIPYNTRKKVNLLQEPLINQILQLLTYLSKEQERIGGGEYLLFEILHYNYFNINHKDIQIIAKHCAHNNKENNIWRNTIENTSKLKEIGIENAQSIEDFEKSLSQWQKDLSNETLPVLLEKILNLGGIINYIYLHPQKIWNTELLSSFFNFLNSETLKNPRSTLAFFLETIEKMRTNDISIDIEKIVHHKDGVNLLTAHSAKGLEFETVYIINAQSTSWENKKSRNFSYKLPDTIERSNEADKTEEERRLFYVAMTRAKRNLFISYPRMKSSDADTDRSTIVKSLFVTELEEKQKLVPEEIILDDDTIANFVLKTMETSALDEEIIEQNYHEEFMKTFRMSASSLNKYLECPVAFYYERVLRIPEATSSYAGFGNAIHFALEQLFKSLKNNTELQFVSEAQLLEYFEHGMRNNMAYFSKTEFKTRLENGKKLIADYYNENIQRWNKNTITEYKINTVTPSGIPISGAIDKIEIQNDHSHFVIDYKTGNPDNAREKLLPPNDKKPHGGEYWRQMVFYKILLATDLTHQWKMDSGAFEFIIKSKKDNKYLTSKIVIDPENIQFVENLISEVYHKIKDKQFQTGCNEPECRWCNFQKNQLLIKSKLN
ncbi:MAG: ATP-dependent helicase [Cytophagales bacterium]|nr:MAG: ATP-dependent helicase [Cytophagales bacterium]